MTEDDLALVRRAVQRTARMSPHVAKRVLEAVFELRDQGALTAEALEQIVADASATERA